ncbi:vitamin B12 dependent-methionine synthase activation domain-containing protein [Sunxiuqinia sp. sy24]|uniref:vitamin B12 dependent-methionine synthase activation domain-containing protein n=1 Tax=Sunxiuqinia sp. sy24 TaxID=3461495 RepID=UPI00404532B9
MNTVKTATELKFHFEDLIIDQDQIIKLLGYNSECLPEPFGSYLEQAMQDCSLLEDIGGTYQIIEEVELAARKSSILANDLEFKVGRTIRKELEGAEKLAFFVCTAGGTLSKKAVALLKGEDPVLGYVYDILGGAIAEAVGDKLQQMIKQEAEKDGYAITNRYSPGYCHWDVSDQHKLFSLLGGSPSGVSLTPSSLMNPVKSISGVIGIGKDVNYREYQCELCQMKNCFYKK